MQRVKIAHSFLQSVKSVPLYNFKLKAGKEFFEPTGRFNRSLLRVILADLEISLIPYNVKSTFRIFIHTYCLLLNMNTGHLQLL